MSRSDHDKASWDLDTRLASADSWLMTRSDSRRRGYTAIAALAVLATACTGSPSAAPTDPSPELNSPDASPTTETRSDPAPTDAAPTSGSGAFELTERTGPRRETTGSVPHVQLDAVPDPAVDAELRRRAFSLPGVIDLPSDRSLPGARGFAFANDVTLVRADVIAGSKEFAHIHPDGSLHVWLPVPLAQEVHDQKWGELHPWVDRDGFWDGVVMLYTPETPEELEVTWGVLVEAFNFVTGQSVSPDDFT